MIIEGVTISDAIPQSFVMHMAKIGKVHLSSSQVTVESIEGGGLNFSKVNFPPNCSVEWVQASRGKDTYAGVASITFRFSELEVGA